MIVSGLILFEFVSTHFNLWWQEYFGTKKETVEHNVWKNSQARVDSAISEILDRRIEFRSAETIAEKRAIASYIRTQYPELNPDRIDNKELRRFFIKCLNDSFNYESLIQK